MCKISDFECVSYFLDRADIIINLVPGNIRAAVQNFQGDHDDPDTSQKRIFSARMYYQESLRYVKDLLVYLQVVDPGKLAPYIEWVTFSNFNLEYAFKVGLVPCLLYDLSTEICAFASATTLVIHTCLSCFNLTQDGLGNSRVQAKSHDAASKVVSTALHIARLACVSKYLLSGDNGANQMDVVKTFNCSYSVQKASVIIARFRVAASSIAKQRSVSVNAIGDISVNSYTFKREIYSKLIPLLLSKFREILGKSLSGKNSLSTL